jgi:hypothetical protein
MILQGMKVAYLHSITTTRAQHRTRDQPVKTCSCFGRYQVCHWVRIGAQEDDQDASSFAMVLNVWHAGRLLGRIADGLQHGEVAGRWKWKVEVEGGGTKECSWRDIWRASPDAVLGPPAGLLSARQRANSATCCPTFSQTVRTCFFFIQYTSDKAGSPPQAI